MSLLFNFNDFYHYALFSSIKDFLETLSYLQMDLIYVCLRNDTPKREALCKFILCDIRNKYCGTE